MHVAVFADLEGAIGIWRMRQCRTGTREWQYGRECLTADVNAVVAGVLDAGDHRVTIRDTHDTGFNCIRPRLDPRARYIGGHYTRPTMWGDVRSYDLVLYVAIHAASGTPEAFFPHTHYGVFAEVRVDSERVCEMELYGATLGAYGLPIGLVSGEDIAVTQARAALPWVRAVEVDKRKQTYMAGENARTALAVGHDRLRREAAAAVRDAASMEPFVFGRPLAFEAIFRTEELARRHNTWDFERNGATVRFEAADIFEGFDLFNRLTFFPRRVYPFRRPLVATLRTLHSFKSRYRAPRPNREGAEPPLGEKR